MPHEEMIEMNDHSAHRRALLAGLGGIAAGALVTGKAKAGPLNPPAGPITSTGKTLTEVEPRIAVSSANTPGDASATYRITQRGSYYLTGNVLGEASKNGISINASNVTLDLMGFEVRGVVNSLDGINMSASSNAIVVRNGLVSNWGGYGVRTRMDAGALEDLQCQLNGQWGIDNTDGFSTRVTRCSGSFNGAGGIRMPRGALVESYVAYGNTGNGFQIDLGSTIVNCIARNNISSGIFAVEKCSVRGNTCSGNNTGIGMTSSNLVVDNFCESNTSLGIFAGGSNNFIARNVCRDHNISWNIAPNNVYLIVNAVASGGLVGNAGGASPGSTNPNANYTY